ncbi:MAG: RIP metalloprotease RseP [Clostridiales bacterium]|nr:MAG: RIP metalloprotease RseP [Clostridiales bacterium]
MAIFIKIIYFILVFSAIVFVHEFGHFIVAKMYKIEVEQFMLGFGPKLIKFKKGETLYSFRAIPLGGAVMLAGETGESDSPNTFKSKARWKQFTVMLAGPFMNFVFAILLLFAVYSFSGQPSNLVTYLNDNSPAMKAGIILGDRIVKFDDTKISNWNDIVEFIKNSKGEKISVTVKRDNKLISNIVVTPEKNIKEDRFIIGVSSNEKSISMAAVSTKNTFVFMSTSIVKFIPKLFSDKKMLKELSGPIGIANVVGKASDAGIMSILVLTAFISINLGVMNLLPIVPLDGGKMFILLIEMCIRRKLSEKVENLISYSGLALMLFLFVMVMYNDIAKMFV